MKKTLLSMFAMAAMLFATSCSQEEEFAPVTDGSEVAVSFSVQLPQEITTRAYSDGKTAQKLMYAFYDAQATEIEPLLYGEKEIKLTTTVEVNLATGKTYNILFWAQDATNKNYKVDFDAQTLTVNYNAEGASALANNEKNDAFYAFVDDLTVNGALTETVELRRPFAQINLGTSDYAAAAEAGLTVSHSAMKAVTLPNVLYFDGGEVEGEETVDFTKAAIPAVTINADGTTTGTEKFPVDGYEYLEMNYVLVGSEKATIDCEFYIYETGKETCLDPAIVVSNVPVQRNHRTNIYGALLTDPATFNVTIEPAYADEENNVEIFADAVKLNDVYYKTIEEALAVAVDGDVIYLGQGEYSLPGNITLSGEKEGKITFEGLAGKTVVKGLGNASGVDVVMKNLTWTSPSTGYDTAFQHAKSVEFEGCDIIGQYYAQSLAPHTFTNCTIDPKTGYLYTYGANCSFENCTFNSSEGKALQVYAEVKPGVESTVTIKDCTFTAAKVANTWDGKPVTAIDINSIYGNKFNVNITNTTATGYGVGLFSGNDFWNIKGGAENVTVTIDGAVVFPPVELNGTYYATLEAALEVAVDGDVLNLAVGTYTIPNNAQGKILTFVGAGAKTIIECNGSQALKGSTVVFEKLTIKTGNDNYQGFQHIAGATYKNCIIENLYTLYVASEFVKCTFEVKGDQYNIWTYGTNSIFTDCTFNCDGKAVLVYTENNNIDDVVTFNNCIFNDKDGLVNETKAAIETGANAATVKHTLNINGCTVNGFAETGVKSEQWGGDNAGTNVWGNKNLMTSDNLKVVIDGVSVYPCVEIGGTSYGSLQSAIAAAGDGAVLKLNKGIYTIPSNAQRKTLTFVGTSNPADVVIACNANSGVGNFYGATVTFENLTIESQNVTYNGFTHVKGATYKNCVINNQLTLYSDGDALKFEGCTFNVAGDSYNLWTWGASADFTNCTFNSDGKGVLVYGGTPESTVKFNTCTFTDNGGIDGKAAIETGDDYDSKYNIHIDNCTVDGFDVTSPKKDLGGTDLGTNVWGNKDRMPADRLNVFVEGTEVY